MDTAPAGHCIVSAQIPSAATLTVDVHVEARLFGTLVTTHSHA
jgi:hypothetical protein